MRDIKDIVFDFRNVVKPFVMGRLKEFNFEGRGDSDMEEFGQEFEQILEAAERGSAASPGETAAPAQGERSNSKVDRIDLKAARETPAWLAVWVGEPTRLLDVRMRYGDLKILLDCYDDVLRFVKGGEYSESKSD